MTASATLTAIPGFPDFSAGDDLVRLIGDRLVASGHALQDGDILCIAHKIFSKAEGCTVALDTVTPSDEALDYARQLNKDPRKVEVVLRQSVRVVRAFRHEGQDTGVMICEHRLGFISANAGVDESNVREHDAVITLPRDPDRSAARLGRGLSDRFGVRIGIVMTDTFGRPWRLGQVNVAIGLYRVPARIGMQGRIDGWGRPMTVTEPAFADELAAASGLVMDKSARTPVVLVRGLEWTDADDSAADLVRNRREDMFT